MPRSSLTKYAWLSITAAIATIALKAGAYWLTGSVGLLSDALESVINLVAAVMALAMLTIAARPPDESHVHGHGKAEYFSSTVEGVLIFVAAGGIMYTAIERLFNPRPLEQLGLGLAVSLVASLINLIVSRVLLSAGKRHRSITLEADAHHLMTDVWTSVAVIGGVGAVWLTGWMWLDAVVAIGVAFNITWTAYQLIRRSVEGLMDASLSEAELKQIETVLQLVDPAKAGTTAQGHHNPRLTPNYPEQFLFIHPGNGALDKSDLIIITRLLHPLTKTDDLHQRKKIEQGRLVIEQLQLAALTRTQLKKCYFRPGKRNAKKCLLFCHFKYLIQ